MKKQYCIRVESNIAEKIDLIARGQNVNSADVIRELILTGLINKQMI